MSSTNRASRRAEFAAHDTEDGVRVRLGHLAPLVGAFAQALPQHAAPRQGHQHRQHLIAIAAGIGHRVDEGVPAASVFTLVEHGIEDAGPKDDDQR